MQGQWWSRASFPTARTWLHAVHDVELVELEVSVVPGLVHLEDACDKGARGHMIDVLPIWNGILRGVRQIQSAVHYRASVEPGPALKLVCVEE